MTFDWLARTVLVSGAWIVCGSLASIAAVCGDMGLAVIIGGCAVACTGFVLAD